MRNGKNLISEWANFIETGNEGAYYILYDHYHDYLLYIAAQKEVDLERAKDHVNDLFLYIFENRDRLDHITNHHNYIVSTFIRKLFHKEHFKDFIPLSMDENNFPENNFLYSSDSLKFYDDEQIAQALKICINKLSHNQAKMIYQKFYLGLTYEVIAAQNGVPVKAVYNAIFRATSRLKCLMNESRFIQIRAAIFSISTLFL